VENLLRLQDALKEYHPVHRMTPKRLPLVLTSEGCRKLKNLYLDTDIGPLDCLGAVLGVGDFQTIKQHAISIEIDGTECRLIDLDTLIKAKRAMGRPRDLMAVQELEAIKERTKKENPEKDKEEME
jgi:hypothetical protein